jgi:DNA-binding LacI/PurR family transcriptional regulator
VACCDDGFQGAGTDWMQLSRVSFDRYEMGVRAAGMMLRTLEDSEKPCASLLAQGRWIAGQQLANAAELIEG